jgi:hypothetical protein
MNVFPKDVNGNIVLQNAPFGSKRVKEGSLYTRMHGVQYAIDAGVNTIEFPIPYVQCKISGVEFVNSEDLDTVSLEVYMGTTKLNQFGFSVNLTKEMYKYESNYDADLFAGLKLVIQYTSLSAKTIGINYILHEVKQ